MPRSKKEESSTKSSKKSRGKEDSVDNIDDIDEILDEVKTKKSSKTHKKTEKSVDSGDDVSDLEDVGNASERETPQEIDREDSGKTKHESIDPTTPIGKLSIKEILVYLMQKGEKEFNPNLRYGARNLLARLRPRNRRNNNYGSKRNEPRKASTANYPDNRRDDNNYNYNYREYDNHRMSAPPRQKGRNDLYRD